MGDYKACVEWSVNSLRDVSIDQQGLLSIGSHAPRGKTITVTANIEKGRRIITRDLYIPRVDDVSGVWTEDVEFDCGTNKEREPADRIEELKAWKDEYAVTWKPFEQRIDYAGHYRRQGRRIEFKINGGNMSPINFRGKGTVSFDKRGRMLLRGVWLGSRHPDEEALLRGEKPVLPCGMRFKRQ